ncbi:type I-C CRISPR-associated protein Cas8c/Csd1 [Nitrosomonas sp. H1_AOB3]|uniref:type I-C CRISPR-associated protein Cas8c/Csd1 n=1 Tax=Nitrosomonas sp. H1_AOB3 TaxID=2741553 RepID=UPI0019363C8F|nr:type I-C CRISPR-associated protein Cas8c/Csd1 [Nitrosomonas sp. H1_AOB3]QOJ08801.1 MAG: type I-C CRISPR-associated protein Cas8c/Csd1 [Nitrosomonas sp. H1_AOB3]
MILQALNEYYTRRRKFDLNSLPPPGMEQVEISFVVVLHKDGRFFNLTDMREGNGKNKRGKFIIAPQSCDRTGQNAWATAFLLWDHPRYVFGMRTPKDVADDGIPSKRLASFKERIIKSFPDPTVDEGINAVYRFVDRAEFSQIESHPLWQEIQQTTGNVSFRLTTDTPAQLICSRPAVIAVAEKELEDTDGYKIEQCLVSGEVGPIAILHPATPLPSKDSKSTAKLVSFQKGSGYDSYGKSQGNNAPVGKRTAFAYTTALNHLLAKGSKQRIQVGDASTVFWCATPGHPMEELFPGFFGEPDKDNPDIGVNAIATLLSAPKTGVGSFEDDGTRFYVLGLAPNAARIAVRFWHVKTVGELAVNIRKHFDDLRITHAPHEPETLSLFRLLVATATLGKAENIPPNLGGDMMRSVIEGVPYPQTLLAGAVRRIRAEQEITYPRAAIIKACINRYSENEELTVSLDENNTNTAYRLGRLFAVLERTQERANPNINATIRDRYYGAASSTPVTVFSTLLKLKNHHLAKLDNKGEAINCEKLLGQIMNGITDFPAHLDLQNQGRFAIGYYHQRQAFFTKSESTNKGE